MLDLLGHRATPQRFEPGFTGADVIHPIANNQHTADLQNLKHIFTSNSSHLNCSNEDAGNNDGGNFFLKK